VVIAVKYCGVCHSDIHPARNEWGISKFPMVPPSSSLRSIYYMTTKKVWLITGASRGFGKLWAEAALQRGDRVAATARDPKALSELVGTYGDAVLPLVLDVTARAAVFQAVERAHRHFGRLDVILSNAGYGTMGSVEETSLDEARANFETNVFGTLSVVQAALPLLRAQKSGHILLVTSIGGLVTFPMGGVYQATKFAVEGLGQTLAQEVADFGIKVTLIEPGPYATEFMSESSMAYTRQIPEYGLMREKLRGMLTGDMFGSPKATINALMQVVDAEVPPLHFIMGNFVPVVRQHYEARLETWRQWETISAAAQG
jgi:NAD(P)-dependent dehydrogenase (short-subunit alcohol dehydrogenase family)